MNTMTRASLAAASALFLSALLAACGGGGGGGGSTPPTHGGGGGGGSATPTPPGATPSPTPGGSGQLLIGSAPLANSTVVFTCGCNGDGGKITTDANGNYTIGGSAPSVSGSGSYTPSGHNLMVVGYAASGTQVWTMMFLGNSPATNLNLSSSPSNATANVSDTADTAAALYVYYAAGTQVTGSDRTFDWFNFNTVASFAQHLRTAPNANEQKLLSDIAAAQSANKSLFPGFTPTWNAVPSEGVNTTITSDVQAVASGGIGADSTLPTPCPSVNGCSGAPTP